MRQSLRDERGSLSSAVAQAKAIIESWHYNAIRPYSSLDYLTPNEFTTKLKTSAQQGAGFQ